MFFLKKFCLLPGLLFFYTSFAQPGKLNTGDVMPQLHLENVLNYKSPSLSFADFKDKYIILDFWNHSCIPCIAALPKLDSLQRRFDDAIQIVLVNKESSDSTLRFFAKHKKWKMPQLPFITGDRQLHDLFPAEGYPYHVWINKQGIISNISGGYNTTAEHIADFITGKDIALKNPTHKKDMIENYLNEKRLKYLYTSSIISLCSDYWDPGSVNGESLRNGSLIRLARNCSSVLELFRSAFAENGKYNFYADYSLLFDVKDTYPYILPSDKNKYDDWFQKHAYSYELILPATKAADRFKIMQEDLQRHFNLKAEVKMKKVQSVVLRRLYFPVRDPAEQQNKNETFIFESDKEEAFYHFLNYPMEKLADQIMVWTSYSYPFFNECRDTGRIDISIREKSIDPLNIDCLVEDLQKQGLTITLEEREIPVLYISEKKNH